MIVTATELPEVLAIDPKVIGDARGYFLEAWQAERYAGYGITEPFVQDNVSFSTRGVLRGLHLQHPTGQGKLISVLRGAIYDVAVDVRRGSPRFGRWIGRILSADNKRQLFIPPGFAHGFLVVAEDALLSYKVTAPYRPEDEIAIRWDDPGIGIQWPIGEAPTISPRDAGADTLASVPAHRLPVYTGADAVRDAAPGAATEPGELAAGRR